MRTVLPLFLGLAVTPGYAQTQLTPTAATFNQRYFRPRNVFQKLTWLDKDGKVLAERMLNLVTRVDSVQHRLVFLQLRNDGKRDSSVAELPTLRPIYVSSQGKGQKTVYDYRDGQTIKASTEEQGKPKVTEAFTMPNPYFDGFLSEYLIGALPLQPGYTAQFDIYRGDLHKNGAVQLKNISTDFIADAAGHLHRVLRVLINSGSNEAQYWIDPGTGELLKMITPLPTGGFFIKTKA
jgi:hypothetical protein